MNITHRRSFLLLVAVFMSFALPAMPARASSGVSASSYIQQVANQALATIADKGNSKPQKQAKLEKLFGENVDFDWVGRFVMGRSWRTATDDQKKRYVVAYKKFLLLHYTSRFTNFSGGTFKVMNEKDDGDGEYTVSMQMQSNDPGSEPIQVDYRMRKESGSTPPFKIFDVIVEGVGLLTTQRSEFSSVIADKGIDYLIEQLSAKVQSGEAAKE